MPSMGTTAASVLKSVVCMRARDGPKTAINTARLLGFPPDGNDR